MYMIWNFFFGFNFVALMWVPFFVCTCFVDFMIKEHDSAGVCTYVTF